MSKYFVEKRVAELFGENKFLCGETVARVIADAGGRDYRDVVCAVTGFCSGMSRSCGQCGVLAGAIMGMGLYVGRSEMSEDHEACYALVQEFCSRFQQRFGSSNCYELIRCDFNNPDDMVRFRRDNVREYCRTIVEFGAEAALSILREHGYLPEEDDCPEIGAGLAVVCAAAS
ncbi:C-GCAxxG-C-C family protein [Pseudodesulfovibrio thermohalotolerans]|uniref:C-GCAxxG-C-C family protein n=1 Tax=Pseudodesulfovibrio thermohalotolerans TaxID=2880651 RepID=UPI0022BA0147|nr:C-GCAxxG-C-C family protein [Pseudodesulfovibrio thermohalotolerans]WFS62399.1 C-GCAxxG-C-C family protein [Pseudodesulfovibrio thermohalotolerans]